MVRTKKKKVEKEIKKEVLVDGVIKTELGYNVVHNGKVEKVYEGSGAYRTAVEDYRILIGV